MSNQVFENYVAAVRRCDSAEDMCRKASNDLSAAHNAVRAIVSTQEERAVVVGDDVVLVRGDSIRVVPLLVL